ncbi:MAG: type I methionyl aminopeptidase [Anaerolineales bacterium]|nr:type I methionyl aminopeptidase [Anaerolineales bacterium]
MIILKSPSELARMRQAGRIVAEVLAALQQRIRPGINTAELDELVYQIITKHKAIPSFKGYRGFPASLCASINEEVVHGIPNKKRYLEEGDIVSFDVGAIYQGYHGDAAVTVGVGEITEAAKELLAVTAGALAAGIAQSRAGNRTGDVSWAIQDYAESRGYSVVREYTGHGIGLQMHEDPQIPNYGQPKQGPLLKPGMTFALEPMVNQGDWRTRVLADNWTVVTRDEKLSAHFEHTIAVTEGEPEILTRL